MSRVRVLHVLHDTPVLGGLERVLTTMGPALAAQGIDVAAVVVPRGAQQGLATEYLAPHLPLVPSAACRLRDFDVIHVHAQDCLHWPVSWALRARLLRRGALVTVHLPSYPPVGVWSPGRVRVTLTLVALGLLLRLAGVGVAAPSDSAARTARRRLGLGTGVIALRNGVPDVGARVLPDAFGASFVGRLEQHKEPSTFVEAVACARALGFPIAADVVGDGELLPSLRTESRRHGDLVRFHGWVPDPTEVVAGSSVLVLTSRHEGAPLVALEAASLGRGVVARDGLEGLAALGDGIAWVSADAGPQEFGEVLAGLARDRDRVAAMGRSAREGYEGVFTPSAAAREWAACYRALSPRR
jgi:glycosyltransferase involved in cell wall biosynthesis